MVNWRDASDGRPSHIIRHFDHARTPLDHLRASNCLPPDHIQALLARRDAINPCLLRCQIYALLDQLLALPLADPAISQDVFLTLFNPLNPMKGAAPSVTLSNECTVSIR